MNLNSVGNFSIPPGTVFGRISDLAPYRPMSDRHRALWERLEKEDEATQNYPPPPTKVYAEIVLDGIVLAEVWENSIVSSNVRECFGLPDLPQDGPDLARRRAEYIAKTVGAEIRYPPKQADQNETPYIPWTETYWGKEILARPHWSVELEEIYKSYAEELARES